jgi:hypothetical protein
VVDHVFSEQWRLLDCLTVFAGLDVVLFVGIHCSIIELRRRERARGDREIGQAEAQLAQVTLTKSTTSSATRQRMTRSPAPSRSTPTWVTDKGLEPLSVCARSSGDVASLDSQAPGDRAVPDTGVGPHAPTLDRTVS